MHLDLEHLGSTDVYVEMEGNAVATKFYLMEDESYQLIEEHLPELQEQLEKKGYSCRVSLEKREEAVDFVEDFLNRERPAEESFQRFSFDVRA